MTLLIDDETIVEESVPLEDYPRIRCNVGRSGERIYHLPVRPAVGTSVNSPHREEVWV